MKKSKFKSFLYYWLEDEENPKKCIIDLIINIIILFSIVLTVMDFLNGLSSRLIKINNYLLYFFILEYCIRFYVATDFRKDVLEQGLLIAVRNKLEWMGKFIHIIDLLAILPFLRVLRIFRTLRLFRFIRFFKLFRAFRIFKDIDRFILMLRGTKGSVRMIIILFTGTFGLIALFSFAIFSIEKGVVNSSFLNFQSTLEYSLSLIGLADSTPISLGGKLLASAVLIANLAFFSFLISLITNKMGEFMDNIKEGKFGKINMKGHIVLCGYTMSTVVVIEELLKKKQNYNRIVLITKQKDIDLDGVIYVYGDFSEIKVLNDVSIKNAKMAVVFAEQLLPHEDKKTIDLRTAMTVFNIEKESPQVHTIAEINYTENAKIISDKIKGDEIIYKEMIDGQIIANSIRHPNISTLIYEMVNLEGRVIQEKPLIDFGFDSEIEFVDLKKYSIENDINFLGFIDTEGKCILAPDNVDKVLPEYRVLYLA